MAKVRITSPVTGTVAALPSSEELERQGERERNAIEIYLAPKDDHTIVAPVAGHLVKIEFHQYTVPESERSAPSYGPGRRKLLREIVADERDWIVPLDDPIRRLQFKTPVTKVGRAVFKIAVEDSDLVLPFWVEVGKGWITHRVALDKPSVEWIEGGKPVRVRQGEVLGELLLGSLALVLLPTDSEVEVSVYDRVTAGKTHIASV